MPKWDCKNISHGEKEDTKAVSNTKKQKVKWSEVNSGTKQQTRSRSSKATVANDDTKTKIVVGYQSRVQVTNSGRNTLVKSIPSINVKKKKSNLQLTADFICILTNYYCLFTVTMTHE